MSRLVINLFALICLSACAGLPVTTTAELLTLSPPSSTPAQQNTESTPYPSPLIQENERWIEIDLQAQKLRLYEGKTMLDEYLAGSGVNQSPQTTTYPGIFEITSKYKGPIETAPGVYVTDVLEFDPEHGNGIHSLPRDAEGNILDERLGQPVSAGCVRVGEAAIVYDFAHLGMTVWVH
ncbi:MAG: L,D-transpeptidase [Anaerolineales bacterium]|jgi:lipoprotein-anchoring transpeptidase ErfK/SrfK